MEPAGTITDGFELDTFKTLLITERPVNAINGFMLLYELGFVPMLKVEGKRRPLDEIRAICVDNTTKLAPQMNKGVGPDLVASSVVITANIGEIDCVIFS